MKQPNMSDEQNEDKNIEWNTQVITQQTFQPR